MLMRCKGNFMIDVKAAPISYTHSNLPMSSVSSCHFPLPADRRGRVLFIPHCHDYDLQDGLIPSTFRRLGSNMTRGILRENQPTVSSWAEVAANNHATSGAQGRVEGSLRSRNSCGSGGPIAHSFRRAPAPGDSHQLEPWSAGSETGCSAFFLHCGSLSLD